MSARKPVNMPRGKPFVKGADSRRNRGGNLNAEAQSYEIRFRNALAKGLAPEEFADLVIKDVKSRRPGAKEFYADRLMGRVTQPISGPPSTDGALTIRVVQVKDQNGNGLTEKED